MKTDGGLRGIFSTHLPDFQWNAIESWSTGIGIPDAEYCSPDGRTGWIEFKKTEGWAVRFKPGQIAWHERRARQKGRSFIAIRRKSTELWLSPGSAVRELATRGLRESVPLGKWLRGPAYWDWPAIRELLKGDGR